MSEILKHNPEVQSYIIACNKKGQASHEIIESLIKNGWSEEDAVVAVLTFYSQEKEDVYNAVNVELSSGAIFYYVPVEKINKKIYWKVPISVAGSLIVVLLPFFLTTGIWKTISGYVLIFTIPIFLTYVMVVFRKLVIEPILSDKQHSKYYYMGKNSLIVKESQWNKPNVYPWKNYHTLLTKSEQDARENSMVRLRQWLNINRQTISLELYLIGGKKSFVYGGYGRYRDVMTLSENREKVYRFLMEKVKYNPK